jgi:hypothetical protein
MCEYWALRNAEWRHKYGTRSRAWQNWFMETFPDGGPVTAEMFKAQEAQFKDLRKKGTAKLLPMGPGGYIMTL